MTIGVAVADPAAAEWIQLSLASLPGLAATPFPAAESPDPAILIIDGDQPGPDFMRGFTALCQQGGPRHAIILGATSSPVARMCEWDSATTIFLTKPYQLADLRDTVAALVAPAAPPGAARHPHAASSPIQLGYLSTLRLPDLLQMLCLSQWTGQILATNLATGARGEIFVNDGVLIHAATGGQQAEAACILMLNWGRCEFRFVEKHPPVLQSIRAHWQEVLLESARLLDESRKGAHA